MKLHEEFRTKLESINDKDWTDIYDQLLMNFGGLKEIESLMSPQLNTLNKFPDSYKHNLINSFSNYGVDNQWVDKFEKVITK